MLFIFYFNELRFRLFYCSLGFFYNFFIILVFIKEVLFFLVKPLLLIVSNKDFFYFIFTNMSDILLVYIQISAVLSFILVLPICFIEIWLFLLEGLFVYEKNNLLFYLMVVVIIFLSVFLLLYIYLIPFIWFFFINFELTDSNSLFGVYYEAKITDYIGFMFHIFFIFLFFGQLPIFMSILLYFNFVRVSFFIYFRKFFIIIFFILGGVFSPPDILSQFLIAGFIIFFYESVVLVFITYYNYFKKLL